MEQILVQSQFRQNNANALYDNVGTTLLNKNMISYFNENYVTHEEDKTSEMKFIWLILKKNMIIKNTIFPNGRKK